METGTQIQIDRNGWIKPNVCSVDKLTCTGHCTHRRNYMLPTFPWTKEVFLKRKITNNNSNYILFVNTRRAIDKWMGCSSKTSTSDTNTKKSHSRTSDNLRWMVEWTHVNDKWTLNFMHDILSSRRYLRYFKISITFEQPKTHSKKPCSRVPSVLLLFCPRHPIYLNYLISQLILSCTHWERFKEAEWKIDQTPVTKQQQKQITEWDLKMSPKHKARSIYSRLYENYWFDHFIFRSNPIL